MKQLVQDIRSGEIKVLEVPEPKPAPGTVLVRTQASVVSPGTERAVASFGSKSLLGKARERPDLVEQVLNKVRQEGLLTTLEAVRNRLQEPLPLGYSSTGEALEVGTGVTEVRPGMRLACAGGGHAVHAEYAIVPKNLVATVPANVTAEQAAFSTLGAVALHGFRLGELQVGSQVAVIGLGVLGDLAMMIARAAGCQPAGIDISPARVERAMELGFQAVGRSEAEAQAVELTGGAGFDAVLICADTEDADPVELAGEIARDRAVVVAVGAVGMDLPRRAYYEKELSFIVSRSYGPGRYDRRYEEGGIDYPLGYVRWTEGRNLEAFLELVSAGRLDPAALITHRFPIAEAPQAYDLIGGSLREEALGILLEYSSKGPAGGRRPPIPTGKAKPARRITLGAVGAGNFATNVLFPKLRSVSDLSLVGLASARGLSSAEAGRRFGFQYATAAFDDLLEDEGINTVAVLTRHHLHADQVCAALEAGKHVFCEKPLAISAEGLSAVWDALKAGECLLTVGFNRRYAPLFEELRSVFALVEGPKVVQYRVNAAALPADHWLNDPAVGGGRLIGEGCHFVDAVVALCGSVPTQVHAESLGAGDPSAENFTVSMRMRDGSLATILYEVMGNESQPKERLEVFGGGRSAVLDDFRRLEIYAGGRRRTRRAWLRQDKGHRALWTAFVDRIAMGGPPPIPYNQLFGVTAATLAAESSLRAGQPAPVAPAPGEE